MSTRIDNFNGRLTVTAPTGGLTVRTEVDINDAVVSVLETKAATLDTAVLLLGAFMEKIIRGMTAEGGTGFSASKLDIAYWDATNNRITVTATGNTASGWFAEDKTAAATTADIIPGSPVAIN